MMVASLEHLSQRFNQIRHSDLAGNSSTQIHFVETLLSRIEQVDGGVRAALLIRADKALDELDKLQQVKVAVSSSGKFSPSEKIQSLTQQLLNLQQSRDSKACGDSFESSLIEREHAVVSELTQQVTLATVNEPVDHASVGVANVDVFNSGAMRLFRESLGQVTIDKRVSKAIMDGPESPGPFNPQGLTIKALTKMRDVSPQYLHRFVGYVDTLLALQHVEANSAVAKASKKKKAK